jgi:hypothetical protein
MPIESEPASDQKRAAKSTVFVEMMIVGMVLTGLLATSLSVLMFLKQGKVKPKPIAPKVVAVTPKPTPVAKPLEPAPPPIAKPVPPDTSAQELAAIDAEIQKAREARAKADLMAWAAEAAAKLLKNRELAAMESAKKAKENTARIAQAKTAIGQRAAQLADDLARMELEKEQVVTKLEVAKNRKGYSILPYRGPNGSWQRPLPIECARDVAQIMPGGPSFRLIDLELSGMTRTSLFSRIVELAVRKAASQSTPDGNAPTVYILFVVRPSGIKAYYEARGRLQAQGVAFGYELVDEQTPIDYPDLGDLTEWPGYVPPQELAEATASDSKASAVTGLGGGTGNGNGTGDGAGTMGSDGLFVWKNGLDGVRPPGGTGGMANSPTSSLGGSTTGGRSLQPGGAGGMGEGLGELGKGISENPSAGGGANAGGLGGLAGSGRSATGSPRVDFGPGTLSQLGRSRMGTGRVGASSGDSLSGSDAEGSGGGAAGTGTSAGNQAGSGKLNLEPPWGQSSDRRRPGGATSGTGIADGVSAGSPNGGNGTFENLVAELASQSGGAGQFKSNSRPGAVPIMPGDLEESAAGTMSEGSQAGSAGASAGRSAAKPANSGLGRSPFSTPPPTLPRFEPAPGTELAASGSSASGSGSGLAGASGTPSGGPPAGSSGGTSSSGSSASGASSSGGQAGQSGSSSSSDEKPEPNRGLMAGMRRIFGTDKNLPEKAWEVGLFCDADGITIRPGEHRLNLTDLQNDTDLLPRTLLAMFEKQVREHPEHYWRPYVRYRLASGGESLMNLSQHQLAQGLVRWPAVMEPVAPAANRAGQVRGR